MKLLYCRRCDSVVRLVMKERSCECGKTSGRYLDSLHAIYTGPAVPFGIANSSFVEAMRNQPFKGKGQEFTAWVMPVECNTMKRGTE